MQPTGSVSVGIVVVFTCFASFLSDQLAVQGCPTIVSRADWEAKPPNGTMTPLRQLLLKVFIHHTVSNTCKDVRSCSAVVRSIQNMHMANGWGDIGYNFLVGGDGRVYMGRGFNTVGELSDNYKAESISISFIGYFHRATPNAEMLEATKKLIKCAVDKGAIHSSYKIHGHRDARCTTCPGDKLYSIIQKWPRFQGGRLSKYVCPRG